MDAMTPEQLANSLEALVVLEERLPIAELPGMAAAAAVRLKRVLPELRGKDPFFAVPVIVWACAKKGVLDEGLLRAVAMRFASNKSISSLPDWGVCALAGPIEGLMTRKMSVVS